MGSLTVDPSVGLPSGRPVIGSVADGVSLPYRLDLGGASSARLVLTLDGVTASDASGPAAGTLSVPANHPSLRLGDQVQVVLRALAADTGAVLASAATSAKVSAGAQLPDSLVMTNGAQTRIRAGDTVHVNRGDVISFQAVISSGADGLRLTGYDLTMDGVSILSDPKPESLGNQQFVAGSWTAPNSNGAHTLVLSGSVEGTSAVQAATVTFSAESTGTLSWITQASDADLAAGVTLAGTLKVSDTFAPVANASVDVKWVADGDSTWAPVGTATTDAAGRFTLSAKPAVTGRFIAHTAGVPSVVGDTTSGTLQIGVRPHVLIEVDQNAVSPGQALTFTVSAPAAMSGVTTMLQLWNGVCWCTVDWTDLSDQGSASLHYTPPVTGTYKFGALTSFAGPYAPTPSGDLSVTVR